MITTQLSLYFQKILLLSYQSFFEKGYQLPYTQIHSCAHMCVCARTHAESYPSL